MNIASRIQSEELDLPVGSYWIKLVAYVLDLVDPLKEEMPRLA